MKKKYAEKGRKRGGKWGLSAWVTDWYRIWQKKKDGHVDDACTNSESRRRVYHTGRQIIRVIPS